MLRESTANCTSSLSLLSSLRRIGTNVSLFRFVNSKIDLSDALSFIFRRLVKSNVDVQVSSLIRFPGERIHRETSQFDCHRLEQKEEKNSAERRRRR